ncbi:hypothetical protein [Roseibium sp.]|uniref:hypothetical protein n=1 Tax=Roseibium sp. TaxID=1936156 RepID=UPI003A970B76
MDESEIASRRQIDPVFDEICSDYDALSTEFLRGGKSMIAENDVMETITALEAEIRQCLLK